MDDEMPKGLAGSPLDCRADEHPAPDGVAVLRARLEQQRVVGQQRHRLIEALTVSGGHGVVALAADAVHTRDVAHQLAYGDRPLLLGVPGHVPLNWRIEVEAA